MRRHIEFKEVNIYIEGKMVTNVTKILNTLFLDVIENGLRFPITFKHQYIPHPFPHRNNEATCVLSFKEAYNLLISNEHDG
jgi:hypothetical protein